MSITYSVPSHCLMIVWAPYFVGTLDKTYEGWKAWWNTGQSCSHHLQGKFWLHYIDKVFTLDSSQTKVLWGSHYINVLRALLKVSNKFCIIGWMHSGYPVMGMENYTPLMLNIDWIKRGKAWGELHEIGHNQQMASFTVAKTVEAGCNIQPVFVNKEVRILITLS